MWIKISPEQGHAAHTHTPPGAHTSQALSGGPIRAHGGAVHVGSGAGGDIFPCRDREVDTELARRDSHLTRTHTGTRAQTSHTPGSRSSRGFLGHTQKPRDIMAGTHLDLFSS